MVVGVMMVLVAMVVGLMVMLVTVFVFMLAMIMMVDITAMTTDFTQLSDELNSLGETLGLSIHAMHEDIFNAMHRI